MNEDKASKRAQDQATDESVKESFPASDPPASHLPDDPPANAEAKWRAAGIERKPTPPAATDERAPDDMDETGEVL